MLTKMKSVRVVWPLLLAALVLTTGTPSTYAWSSAQATVSVFGGAGTDWGFSIAVDSSGNVYTTGYFQGTVDFDPGAGTSNLTSAGGADVFVSKLDSSGALVWAKSFGGTSNDYGNSIAVDSSGNFYTTGNFRGTADFDPGAGTSNLTAARDSDVFVSKLDSSGALVWAKIFGGTSYDVGYSIAVDSSGNVYTTGYFEGTVDFDPGAGTSNLTSAGIDVFVSKLDSSGALVWAKSFGGTSNDYGRDIAVDSSGNVYTTGYFDGTVDFDPGAGTSNLTSAGGNDVFVSKLDSSGALVWAKGFGGTSNDRGQSIAVDSSGNVYTTGYFAGTVDFDPGAGTSNLTSAGGDDVFVLKLTSSGEALTVALVYVPPILLYVPPMLPIIAPSIAVNSGVISCTIGEYSRAATSVVFSLFVDGNHLATNFSATGDYLPSWLAPWASASTVQRTASLTSASWDIGVVGNGSRASCWTLAYSQHATGLISSNSISLR